MLSEYDQRQVARMFDVVEAYQASGIEALHSLHASLGFLMNALESKDQQWVRELHEQWAVLEEVLASSSHRSPRWEFNEDEQRLVSSAADRITSIVRAVHKANVQDAY